MVKICYNKKRRYISTLIGDNRMATALDVAKAFLKLSDPDSGDVLTNLKLQKLVYYAQGFNIALTGKPLFKEKIAAWEHGPVVPELYHTFKAFGSSQVAVDDELSENALSKEELELIAEVNKVYGQFSAWKLRDMTHNEAPWLQTERNESIANEKLADYFKTQIK